TTASSGAPAGAGCGTGNPWFCCAAPLTGRIAPRWVWRRTPRRRGTLPSLRKEKHNSAFVFEDSPMPINKDKVVTLHYTLLDGADGSELERSAEDAPLLYLHGAGNILPGLEAALEGKDVGEDVEVTLAAADAYGERD